LLCRRPSRESKGGWRAATGEVGALHFWLPLSPRSSRIHAQAYDSLANLSPTNYMSAVPTPSPADGRADTPVANHLAVEIRILISIIGKLSLRAMEQRISAALPGMSLLQYGLLRVLASEPCTLSELSSRMMLTPSTLVPAVDKLEREGYVVRSKDPSDRRRTPLIVTDAGRRALQAVPPFHDEDALVKSVSVMGPARAESLRAMLHELLMGMSDDRTMIEDLLANHPERTCLRAAPLPSAASRCRRGG